MGTFNIVGGFTSKDTVDEFKGYSNSYNPTPNTDDDDFFSDFTEEKTKSVDDELRDLFGEPVKADIIYTDKDGVEYTQDTLKTEIERAKKEEGVDRETVREWLKGEGLSDKFPEYNKTIGEHLGDFGNILKKRAGEVGGVVRDVGTGLTAGVAEGVVNLADLSDQALDATLGEAIRKIGTSVDPNFELDRSGIREAFAGDRKLIEEAVKAIADEESLATKTGQLAGELGVTSLIPAGGVAKVGERLSKIPGGTKVVEALSKITPEIGKKIGGLAVRGAEEGAKFGAVAEGTPEAVGTGAKVGAIATPVTAGLAKVTGDAIKSLSTKLTTSGLVNPAKLAKVNNQLKASGMEGFKDVDATAKYLLDKGIKGDKEAIISQLRQVGNMSKKQVDDALASIDTLYKDETINKGLETVIRELKGKVGLEEELLKARNLLLKSQKGKGLTLTELNQGKRLMGNNLNIFNETGVISKEPKARGFAKVLDQAKKSIETKAKEAGLPDIRLLNKDTQVSTELANAIARREATEEARELLTSYIISPGAGGVIGGFTGNTWEERAKNAVLGAITGGIAGSTRIKSNIGSFFNKLTPAEKKSFQDYIESKAVTLLPTALEQKIEDFINSNR